MNSFFKQIGITYNMRLNEWYAYRIPYLGRPEKMIEHTLSKIILSFYSHSRKWRDVWYDFKVIWRIIYATVAAFLLTCLLIYRLKLVVCISKSVDIIILI